MSKRAFSWQGVGVWDRIVSSGRSGADTPEPGVIITPRHDFSLAFVIGPHDGGTEMERLLEARYEIKPPPALRAACGTSLDLIWSGMSQWLAVSVRPQMPTELAAELAGMAAVTDQSDARAVLRLNGPHVRDALVKGCPVDLHDRAFRRGDTIITTIAGIGVQIWWADVDDALHLAVPRSMAGSFWSWLLPSVQEFGVEVLPPRRG